MALARWQDSRPRTGDKVSVKLERGYPHQWLGLVDHVDATGRPYIVFLNSNIPSRYLADEPVGIVERAADRRIS